MLLEQLPSHPGHPAAVAVSATRMRPTAAAKTTAKVSLKEAMAGSAELARVSARTTYEILTSLSACQSHSKTGPWNGLVGGIEDASNSLLNVFENRL